MGVEIATDQSTLYGYDKNGCMTLKPGMRLTYDHREMLSAVSRDDGLQVEFTYTYAAQRARKRVTQGSSVQNTLYIGESFEVRHDGTTLRFVRGPAGEATRVVSSTGDEQVLHNDYLGNVIVSRDLKTGRNVALSYSPYGQHSSLGARQTTAMFAGKRLDAETGLYYFKMRYYDPDIGRFISPDPVAVTNAERGRLRPTSLNPYAYALDNPMRYTDPNGLWTFWEGALTVVTAIAVTAVAVTT